MELENIYSVDGAVEGESREAHMYTGGGRHAYELMAPLLLLILIPIYPKYFS